MGKYYFLSDLHLGARYIESRIEAERRVVEFLDHIANDAECIYLLGDILDYWYEYRYVVPRGYVRFLGKLAELSDSGIKIKWLIGNHDIWIFDYLPEELGIEVIDGSLMEKIDGKLFYMAHGDAAGDLKPSFRLLRKIFRNRFCQRLYASIHPRWTIPFALNWSKSSRCGGSDINLLAAERKESMLAPLIKESTRLLSENPYINYFIFGHLHILERRHLTPSAELIVLGEWIRTFSYAVFDGTRMELKKWKKEVGD